MSRLSDALFDYLIEVFPPDRAYAPAAFDRDEMPRSVAHFLDTALRHGLAIEADALEAARSSWFDYDHPDVQQAFYNFIDTLGQHAQVPAEAWAETLAQATEQVTDYVIAPVTALAGFVFDRDEALPASTILSRLEYFAPYGYLRDGAQAYVAEEELEALERERFVSLLERIDRQMTAGLDAAGWLDLLGPLFDLAERASSTAGVPTEALRDFFSNKGKEKIQVRLKAEHDEHGSDVFTRTDLLRLLRDVLPPSASRSTSPAASPAPAAAHPEGPVPLWMRFQQQEHQEPGGPSHLPVTPPRVHPPPRAVPSEPDEAVPLWMRFQQQTGQDAPPAAEPRRASVPPPTPRPTARPAQPPPTPAPEPEPEDELTRLERAVLGERGMERRDFFVEQLFSGSAEEYEQTLRQLVAAPTWQRASSIIAQEVFRKHQVNIYGKPAVAFTNAVEARFDDEEEP